MIWHKNLFFGIAFSLGAFGEFGGWMGRAIAYKCPYSATLLEEPLVTLILDTLSSLYLICILNEYHDLYHLLSQQPAPTVSSA
jgi:hypothetical protein